MNSKTLNEMIENKKGYRTEAFRGSGVRNLREIIRFEIQEMENGDIPYYMQSAYGIIGGISCNDWEEFVDDCHDNIDYVLDEIMEFLTEELKVKEDDLVGLWLTSKEVVISYYEGEGCVDKYSLDRPYIVLSDLGSDGALFAFSEDIAYEQEAE